MKKLPILALLLVLFANVNAQDIPYGSNESAGKYLTVNGAKLYYEVYGEGRPLLLLHGDTFGYIDDFSEYIPLLSKHFKVIAVGMRGHGRSEMGTQSFSYGLFASDAITILRKESQDSAVVLGFSAGAITGYYLAAYYPGVVRRLVAMGGALNRNGYTAKGLAELKELNLADLKKKYPEFVSSREKIMAQPERYQELIDSLRTTWLTKTYIETQKAQAIKCPVLTVGGDRDDYLSLSNFVEIYKTIPRSQLAIFPHCDHVGLIINTPMFESTVMPFLQAGAAL